MKQAIRTVLSAAFFISWFSFQSLDAGEIRSFSGKVKIQAPEGWHADTTEFFNSGKGYENSIVKVKKWNLSFRFEYIKNTKSDQILQLLVEHRLPEPLGLSDWQEEGNYEIVRPSLGSSEVLVKGRNGAEQYWPIHLMELDGGVLILVVRLPASGEPVASEMRERAAVAEILAVLRGARTALDHGAMRIGDFHRKWERAPVNLSQAYEAILKRSEVAKNVEKIKNDSALFWDLNEQWEVEIENLWGLGNGSKLDELFRSHEVKDSQRMSIIIIRGFLNSIFLKKSDIETVKREVTDLLAAGKSPYSPYNDAYRLPKTIDEMVRRKQALRR